MFIVKPLIFWSTHKSCVGAGKQIQSTFKHITICIHNGIQCCKLLTFEIFLYIVFHFYHKRIIILYIILYILHLYNISIKTNYNNISSRQLLMLCREGLVDCGCWVCGWRLRGWWLRGWRLRGWRLRDCGWSYRHSLAETATPTKSGEFWRWKKNN